MARMTSGFIIKSWLRPVGVPSSCQAKPQKQKAIKKKACLLFYEAVKITSEPSCSTSPTDRKAGMCSAPALQVGSVNSRGAERDATGSTHFHREQLLHPPNDCGNDWKQHDDPSERWASISDGAAEWTGSSQSTGCLRAASSIRCRKSIRCGRCISCITSIRIKEDIDPKQVSYLTLQCHQGQKVKGTLSRLIQDNIHNRLQTFPIRKMQQHWDWTLVFNSGQSAPARWVVSP